MRILLVLIALVLPSCIKRVDVATDQLGVIHSNGKLLQPGNHVIPFYEEFAIYEISEQLLTEDIQVMTKDLKLASAEFSLRYFPSAVDTLDHKFGEMYEERLVSPELRLSVRNVFAQLSAATLRELGIKQIELRVREDLTIILRRNNVIVSDLELKSLELP